MPITREEYIRALSGNDLMTRQGHNYDEFHAWVPFSAEFTMPQWVTMPHRTEGLFTRFLTQTVPNKNKPPKRVTRFDLMRESWTENKIAEK